MIKKGLIGLGALSLVTCGVIGFPAAYSYCKTSAGIVRDGIQDNIPFEVEVARLEQMVDDLDEVIRRHQKLVLEREVDHEMIEEELDDREFEIEKQKDDLSQARDLLRSDETAFVIGTRSYTRGQVREDALKRVEAFENAREMLDIRRETAATLGQALASARHQLGEMRQKRVEYVEMLQSLRAEHLQLEARKQLAATVQGLGLPDIDSEFGDVENLYQRLSKRLKVENEMLERSPHPTHFDIDYTETDSTGPAVLDRIDEALDGKKVDFPEEIAVPEEAPGDDPGVDYNPQIAANITR